MDFQGLLDISNNLLSLVLVIVSAVSGLFIFFSDPLRRWRFFGYLPTTILAVIDPIRKKILVVQYDKKFYGHKLPLQLPQGGIYSNNVGDAVKDVLEKEIGLSQNYFDIKHVRNLGELNISSNYERMKKFQYGIVGVSPLIRGKGYIGCICVCDAKEVERVSHRGAGIESAYFIPIETFIRNQTVKGDNYDKKRRIYFKLMNYVESYLKNRST